MKFEDCKIGTRVKLEGEITNGSNDERSVLIKDDSGIWGYVDPRLLSLAGAKHAPKRRRRKGDLMRIVGFGGRLFGKGIKKTLANGYKFGDVVRLVDDEDTGGDVRVPNEVLKWGNRLCVACLELVEAVEDQKEYIVDIDDEFVYVRSRRRDREIVATIRYSSGLMTRENAIAGAKQLCVSLNGGEEN